MRQLQMQRLLWTLLLAACQPVVDVVRTDLPLRGITSASAGQRIVFMGHRDDLSAELRDSLVGNAASEPWYRLHLAESLISPTVGNTTHDLDKDPGIRFVVNFRVPDPLDSNHSYYRELDATSAGGSITGTLTIARNEPATAVADNGTVLRVGFTCEITQTIVLPTATLTNHRAHFTVGAMNTIPDTPKP